MSAEDADESVKAGSKYPDTRQNEGQILTGSGTDTLLQTDGLVKSFGGFHAIDGIDFAVEAGEMHCLIGPNGAGKSTLMKLITGAHEASAGRIFYDGQEITNLDSHERIRRGLSIKFQVPSVYDELTVRENVRLPVQRFFDSGMREETIAETLETVGLADRADDIVGDLSHGQQQQLEIGMAASIDPDLLLLDEPVAGLSLDERDTIAERIQTLNETRSIAFVVIEHDTDFVAKIADEVTVLHQGRIFREGPIQELRDDPAVRRIYLGGENDA